MSPEDVAMQTLAAGGRQMEGRAGPASVLGTVVVAVGLEVGDDGGSSA